MVGDHLRRDRPHGGTCSRGNSPSSPLCLPSRANLRNTQSRRGDSTMVVSSGESVLGFRIERSPSPRTSDAGEQRARRLRVKRYEKSFVAREASSTCPSVSAFCKRSLRSTDGPSASAFSEAAGHKLRNMTAFQHAGQPTVRARHPPRPRPVPGIRKSSQSLGKETCRANQCPALIPLHDRRRTEAIGALCMNHGNAERASEPAQGEPCANVRPANTLSGASPRTTSRPRTLTALWRYRVALRRSNPMFWSNVS